MSIYDDLTAIGQEILAEFKQGTVKLISVVAAAGAGDDPGAPTETTYVLDAVVTGSKFTFVKGVSYAPLQGGFVGMADLIVTAAPIAGVTPGKSDFIEIDGIRHKIIEDMSNPAAGSRVVWKFLVRK